MDYQEAIEQLKFDMEMITFDPYSGEIIPLKVLKNRNNDNYKAYIADELAIKALEEVQKYTEIGTLEEVREAVERQQAKEPIEFDGHWYRCPKCGTYAGGLKGNYCHNCGQHIDWSEEDD